MAHGVKIPKHKELSKDKEIGRYNKPKYVYIPLISGNDTNITLMVSKGDYVCKGAVVGKRKGKFSLPIHSSVSGTVVDFVLKTVYNGDDIKCIVIQNDFKEQMVESSIKDKYSREEFVELLKDMGIRGMGGADFPTYVKYDGTKNIKTLIVNAVECEPYITADYEVLKNNSEAILETIDLIMDINTIEEGFIAIKKHNTNIKELLNTYIGTYPKIKIVEVPDLYPMGWERYLIKYIKKVNYDNLPLERGIVVNNVSTVYSIYEAIKYSKPLIERMVTFTGEMFNEPMNYWLKIGTSVKDIVEKMGIDEETLLVAGGPMTGNSVPNSDLIVTSNLNCVLALKKHIYHSQECLRCGKCIKVCPSKISPVLIKDYIDNLDRLKELNVNKCVECGLCSYVCPSKIFVREFVRQAKNNLKEVE